MLITDGARVVSASLGGDIGVPEPVVDVPVDSDSGVDTVDEDGEGEDGGLSMTALDRLDATAAASASLRFFSSRAIFHAGTGRPSCPITTSADPLVPSLEPISLSII